MLNAETVLWLSAFLRRRQLRQAGHSPQAAMLQVATEFSLPPLNWRGVPVIGCQYIPPIGQRVEPWSFVLYNNDPAPITRPIAEELSSIFAKFGISVEIK